MSFLILMYPRPCRAKNGVFSTASSAGAAAVWVALRRSTSFWGPARREARSFVPTGSVHRPKPPARRRTVGPIRCARRVCSRPGLLNTPKNARCSPGDPCAQRKPCPCRYPHRHFAALTFLNAGPELVNLASRVAPDRQGMKVCREFRTSRRPLNAAFVRAGLPEQETLRPAPPEPHGRHSLSYPPAFRKSKCQKIRFFDSVLYNPPFVGTIQRVRKQKGLIRVA